MTRFSEEQMVTILREADEKPLPEVAKKHGVSAQTIWAWRKHFGSLEPSDVKRLRQLEQENGRLKKMVADRDLEIDVLKEITRKTWQAHAWRRHSNEVRPHSSLGYLTPAAFKAKHLAEGIGGRSPAKSARADPDEERSAAR